MTATDELRKMLDERGVKWWRSVFDPQHETFYDVNGVGFIVTEFPEIERMSLACDMRITPEQAIAATLGREPWVNPTWERWHKSLKHDEIKSIGDAVEQLMYEAIKFGGDMGPNGNTYNGIDEGDVLTKEYIDGWVEKFATLGARTCHEVEDEDTGFICCSECGAIHDESYTGYFCWCCGRKVVDE